MIYGYIRVSTDHQNVANQKHEIVLYAQKHQYDIDKWVAEVISSREALNKRKLGKLLKKLKKDDILIATEISRLGRNLLEVMAILQSCLEKGCQVWTLKEGYKLGRDIQSKVLAFAFSLASEIERQLISERTRLALKRIKDEGKTLGRPHSETYKMLASKHRFIVKALKHQVSKAVIAKKLGCSWSMLSRYIKKNIDNSLNIDK